MNKLIDGDLLDLAEKIEGPCICGANGECPPCKLALFASVAVANERERCRRIAAHYEKGGKGDPMKKLEEEAINAVAEWKAMCGGCLRPDISDVPLQLLVGYVRRALEEERKACVRLVKAALESGGDRDFGLGMRLLKDLRSQKKVEKGS